MPLKTECVSSQNANRSKKFHDRKYVENKKGMTTLQENEDTFYNFHMNPKT
jgi:hypothetical protein